jgi:hypothetical protein
VSHLWTKDAAGAWTVHLLETDLVALAGGAPVPLPAPEALGSVTGPVLVRAGVARGADQWVLLCGAASGTRVNGAPVPVGARVLADRDAIALGGGRTLCFSAERLAEVVPFPGGDAATSCIRCKLPLEPGTPAVRCPAPDCGFWAHQSDDLPCWSYTEGCAACGHPTALDAGLQWSPAEL